MPVETQSGPDLPVLRMADGRTIVGWSAGSPIFADAEPATPAAVATPMPRGVGWLLKPGDIVCDWFNVKEADNRGLLRMVINLALYTKIGALIAFLAS